MLYQPSASEPILVTDLLHRLIKQNITAKHDFASDLLEYLSPEIVHKALTGDLPVNAKDLMFTNIPADWEEQKRVVGLG